MFFAPQQPAPAHKSEFRTVRAIEPHAPVRNHRFHARGFVFEAEHRKSVARKSKNRYFVAAVMISAYPRLTAVAERYAGYFGIRTDSRRAGCGGGGRRSGGGDDRVGDGY